MRPKLFTELFFLDEATALAAGHRPCHLCNRARFDEFFAAWSHHFAMSRPTVKDVDGMLHAARIDDVGRKKTFFADAEQLFDGLMIKIPGSTQPYLVHCDGIYPWTSHGYGIKDDLPRGEVEVLTPQPIHELLRAGLKVGPRNPLLAW